MGRCMVGEESVGGEFLVGGGRMEWKGGWRVRGWVVDRWLGMMNGWVHRGPVVMQVARLVVGEGWPNIWVVAGW